MSYTYYEGGRLATRTWARGPVTTYSYDLETGELTDIVYSDTTPDVHFTYDDLGRQKTITDAVGLRTFAYKPDTLQLDSENIAGIYNRTINRTYDEKGRADGFYTGPDYAVGYGFDGRGRLNAVSWNAGGVQDTATYGLL